MSCDHKNSDQQPRFNGGTLGPPPRRLSSRCWALSKSWREQAKSIFAAKRGDSSTPINGIRLTERRSERRILSAARYSSDNSDLMLLLVVSESSRCPAFPRTPRTMCPISSATLKTAAEGTVSPSTAARRKLFAEDKAGRRTSSTKKRIVDLLEISWTQRAFLRVLPFRTS
jgi:hypothetical protein